MQPFAVPSTAEVRYQKYNDENGLPKPYGFFRPFRPSQLGATSTHASRRRACCTSVAGSRTSCFSKVGTVQP